MRYTVKDIEKMEKRLDKIKNTDGDMILPSLLIFGVGGTGFTTALSQGGPLWATLVSAGVALYGAAKFLRIINAEQISDRLRQKIAGANQELEREMYSKSK